ncbi:hypothetical protein Cgig2_032790 [Carnegiea gigantea]|uniref:Autophagy-related protein 27 n=1 Tax=Carnegiea gigantea TaxID=171969 RepID=A0A9Q1Q8K6_9CARY|nr:hypothetical protein Cgig2_032790 [Carnegiea gigantea]
MTSALNPPNFILFPLLILLQLGSYSVHAASCEYGVVQRNKLYSYNLASPVGDFPHGVLSEDGFYKVAANDTIIWFQLCDGMIFNHDPPACVDCSDCGGPSRCGMGCSALVAKNTGGYYVCTSIGRDFNYDIKLMSKDTPTKGVNVTISSKSHGRNCSLTVSVICDSKGVKVTLLRHPSGCSKTVAVHGEGWGWFSILLTILLCAIGAYLLVGAVYRLSQTWIFGLAYRIEQRYYLIPMTTEFLELAPIADMNLEAPEHSEHAVVEVCLCHWCKGLEDLLTITEAHIHRLTSEHLWPISFAKWVAARQPEMILKIGQGT